LPGLEEQNAWCRQKVRGVKEETMRRLIGKTLGMLGGIALLLGITLVPVGAAAQVPFVAGYAGSFTWVDSSHVQLAGLGSASYLGLSTNSGSVAMLGPASCAGGFKIHDSETLTSTSNGQQVTFTVDDEACPTATPNVYHQHGTYVVTGGTGAYAGASGQGTFDCYGDFGHLTYFFTLVGTIS
jgi:hypothetical protein